VAGFGGLWEFEPMSVLGSVKLKAPEKRATPRFCP
jgi:hypothetical protein